MSDKVTTEEPLLKKAAPGAKDGVFFNMAAKPQIPEKNSAKRPATAEVDLPNYDAIADLSPPNYVETIVLARDISDVVFEGVPVGSYFSFFASCIISVIFEFIGFLMAFFILPTYSGKYGALAGLGLTIAFMASSIESNPHASQYQHPKASKNPSQKTYFWISLALMAVGYLCSIYAFLAFRRIRFLAKQYLIESAGV